MFKSWNLAVVDRNLKPERLRICRVTDSLSGGGAAEPGPHAQCRAGGSPLRRASWLGRRRPSHKYETKPITSLRTVEIRMKSVQWVQCKPPVSEHKKSVESIGFKFQSRFRSLPRESRGQKRLGDDSDGVAAECARICSGTRAVTARWARGPRPSSGLSAGMLGYYHLQILVVVPQCLFVRRGGRRPFRYKGPGLGPNRAR